MAREPEHIHEHDPTHTHDHNNATTNAGDHHHGKQKYHPRRHTHPTLATPHPCRERYAGLPECLGGQGVTHRYDRTRNTYVDDHDIKTTDLGNSYDDHYYELGRHTTHKHYFDHHDHNHANIDSNDEDAGWRTPTTPTSPGAAAAPAPT